MQFKVFTDGGCLGNPGLCAIAYVIYHDNNLVVKHSEKIGHGTNNIAEYQAVIKALEKLKEILPLCGAVPDKISFFADSSLLVNQLNGLFKVKNSNIREFILKIRILEQEINIPITYSHVLREQNTLADSLVKQAFK